MAGGVVFNDGQRVSDVRPEEPPPSRSPPKRTIHQEFADVQGRRNSTGMDRGAVLF